jgi:hypothetical protein
MRSVALSLLLASCAASSTAKPVQNRSIAPVLTQTGMARIGATTPARRGAIKIPAPFVATEHQTPYATEVRVTKNNQLAFVVRGDATQTWEIEVRTPDVATEDGAAVGMRWEQLQRRDELLCQGGPVEGDREIHCYRGRLGYTFVGRNDNLGGGARIWPDDREQTLRGLRVVRVRWNAEPQLVDDSHLMEMGGLENEEAGALPRP